MSRNEEVELTNMCMICDGKGNVLVQNKKNHPTWSGWNFPGGHVEKGEYVTPSVIREMKEETGMDFEVYDAGNAAYRRPFFMGAGFTDESCNAVFGFASGASSREELEDTETIQVLIVDKHEAKRILEEEKVSIRAAYLLMQFIHTDRNSPFSFLE